MDGPRSLAPNPDRASADCGRQPSRATRNRHPGMVSVGPSTSNPRWFIGHPQVRLLGCTFRARFTKETKEKYPLYCSAVEVAGADALKRFTKTGSKYATKLIQRPRLQFRGRRHPKKGAERIWDAYTSRLQGAKNCNMEQPGPGSEGATRKRKHNFTDQEI